jgi:hypothetical protein
MKILAEGFIIADSLLFRAIVDSARVMADFAQKNRWREKYVEVGK